MVHEDGKPTVTRMPAVRVTPPPVATMLRAYVPWTTCGAAVTERTEVPFVNSAGLNVTVIPVGRFKAERLTVDVNPFKAVTATENWFPVPNAIV